RNSQWIGVTVDRSNNSTVPGTSVSGTTPATSLPADRRKLIINIDNDGARTIEVTGAAATITDIGNALQTAVKALTPLRASTPSAAYSSFSVSTTGNIYTLTSGSTGKHSSV